MSESKQQIWIIGLTNDGNSIPVICENSTASIENSLPLHKCPECQEKIEWGSCKCSELIRAAEIENDKIRAFFNADGCREQDTSSGHSLPFLNEIYNRRLAK